MVDTFRYDLPMVDPADLTFAAALASPPPPSRRPMPPTTYTGGIPFLTAIREGKLDEAKTIYDVEKVDPNVAEEREETGLHHAARAGFLEMVKFLLEIGADVNRKDVSEQGAIHLAASLGHLDVVEELIRAGSTLDDVDRFNRSPLMWAVAFGYVEIVKLLLQAGASVATQRKRHALHEACKRGFHELAQLLIDAGAPVNNPQHFSGYEPWSPLHIAVRQGYLDCVKLLIRAGADVNSVNAGKHTPLHEAAYEGRDDIMSELLLRGADPHAVSHQQRTPLHEACVRGKVRSAIMLLDVNSKVNAKDFRRDTPLHLILRGLCLHDIKVQLTSVLLQYGASPTVLGGEDDTPLDIARQTRRKSYLELLQAALGMPQPLTQMCRVLLRKQLACHWDYIAELPLPITLKSFLQFENGF